MTEDCVKDLEKCLQERVAGYTQSEDLSHLTAEALREITANQGIDFATALLYDRVIRSARHGPFIEQLNQLRESPRSTRPIRATLAIAPGSFYEEFPQAGADGRLLREQAEKYGCPSAMIPVPSVGRLTENAGVILDWLSNQPDGPIILGSVCRGGSDVKLAMAQPSADYAFRNVVAWINVSGILDGTPLADWLFSNTFRKLFYSLMLRLRGHTFEFVKDLRCGSGTPLDIELTLPKHINMISLVGFPLVQHANNRLARNCHRRISRYGPNEGLILLADAFRWPGWVYPVWGADHYMQPDWDLPSLACALLEYIAEDLSLSSPSKHRR